MLYVQLFVKGMITEVGWSSHRIGPTATRRDSKRRESCDDSVLCYSELAPSELRTVRAGIMKGTN
jgi:hypothetical protein